MRMPGITEIFSCEGHYIYKVREMNDTPKLRLKYDTTFVFLDDIKGARIMRTFDAILTFAVDVIIRKKSNIASELIELGYNFKDVNTITKIINIFLNVDKDKEHLNFEYLIDYEEILMELGFWKYLLDQYPYINYVERTRLDNNPYLATFERKRH